MLGPAPELPSLTPPVIPPAPSATTVPPRYENPEPELLSPLFTKKTYVPFKLALPNCSVIGAEAENAVLAWEVAVTVTEDFGGDAGAVYKPFASMVP